MLQDQLRTYMYVIASYEHLMIRAVVIVGSLAEVRAE
jgi:hypothetical protein